MFLENWCYFGHQMLSAYNEGNLGLPKNIELFQVSNSNIKGVELTSKGVKDCNITL